jgi:hypothetical protein
LRAGFLPTSNCYAARTELRKFLTSIFSRLLSEDSDCAVLAQKVIRATREPMTSPKRHRSAKLHAVAIGIACHAAY